MVYTVIADMKMPSPAPAMHRPTKSCAREPAEQAMADPAANTIAPSDIVRILDILFESGPENRDASEAVKRMDETINPWSVGSIFWSLKN